MDRIVPIARFAVPLGGQQIELQQVEFASGGLSLLRVRIREGRRFTIFDIDPGTAALWGTAMRDWAASRPEAAA